jgi:hypothetical protein
MIEVKLLIDIYLWTCCLVQNAGIIFHAEQHTKQSNYLSGTDAQSFAWTIPVTTTNLYSEIKHSCFRQVLTCLGFKLKHEV